MKKVLLCIIVLVLLSMTIYSSIRLNNIKNSNKNLENEISKIDNNIKKIIEDNKNYEAEINDLKDKSKDKLEEQEIWLKAKEKLNQAL